MPDALKHISLDKRDGFEDCLTILTNSERIGLVVCGLVLDVISNAYPCAAQFVVLCSFLSLAAVVTVFVLYLVSAILFPSCPFLTTLDQSTVIRQAR